MTKLNYTKLMNDDPFELGHMVNVEGQLVTFYEHPTQGDAHPIIAVWHEGQIAASTDFFDLEDMANEEHPEYQPIFVDGNCLEFDDFAQRKYGSLDEYYKQRMFNRYK